jgi:hypothetical protein
MCTSGQSFWSTPLFSGSDVQTTAAGGSGGEGFTHWFTAGHLLLFLVGAFVGLFVYKKL